MPLPDQEAIDAQVQAYAEAARETSDAEPQPIKPDTVSGSVAAPIYLGKDTQFIPVKYILHFAEVHCLNCGHLSHESKFYAMNYIRSRMTGQHIKHMVPVDRALYNIPVERVPLRSHTTPFCAECETIDLTHLPEPPQEALVYDLDEPRLKGQKPKAKDDSKPKTKTQPTADDLA